MVRLVHLLTDGLVVTLVEGFADSQDALDFADDVGSTLVVLFADFILHLFELSEGSITEELDLGVALSEDGYDILAALTTLVISGASELVLDAAVDE